MVTNHILDSARIGQGVSIWHFAYVRENTEIGDNVKIGSFAHVDYDVKVGQSTKIEGQTYIPPHTRIGKNVFIRPHSQTIHTPCATAWQDQIKFRFWLVSGTDLN